jgi:hypothetical protein
VVGRYDLESHELAILVEIVRCVDQLDDLDEIIRTDGIMVPVLPYGTKVNPALVEARQLRITLARLQAALRLPAGDEDEQGDERRPQRRTGVRGVYSVAG